MEPSNLDRKKGVMHMGASGRKIEFCTGFLLAVWLLAAFWGPCVSAEEKNGTVLRVAFPQVEGYTMTDEDGERYGLVVDYLNEIAKYTGWKYEYIDTDNNSVVDNFLEGKFDLMGGTYYSEEFENYFAYPEYNSGYSHLVLLARKEDRSIRNYDLGTLQGKTIGIYENSQESIRRLKEWLDYQELDCELKYYDYEDLQKTGSLYRFLEDGEVDLLVGSNAGKSSDFYVAAEFESQAHYIVAQPDDRKILEELNMALGKIYESDPNFAAKVYEKNFQGLDTGYAGLNHEELDYIKKKGTVTVAVPSDAAITAPSPICTPGRMTLSRPIHTSLPTTISPLNGSWPRCGGAFSAHAPPNTAKVYVVTLLRRWFAAPMINFTPEAIAQNLPITSRSPNSG